MTTGYAIFSGTDYVQRYYNQELFAEKWWADTKRKNYEADVWYNKNRNAIGLRLLKGITEGKHVLDIGCLGWPEAEFIASIGAREIIKADIIGGDGVLQEDACRLSFPSESFDVVICRDVIEHVLDAEKAMQEARRVLRPGGYYYLSTPNGYNVCPDGKIHVRAYTPLSLLRELEIQGFEVVGKMGDVPNILHSLMPLADMGFHIALKEFKDTQELIADNPLAYYTGTFLYVLARKVEA